MVDEIVPVPARGDFVWIDLSTTDRQGHEQMGHRPALVLTLQNFNRVLGLAIICPVTTEGKGYPFEVEIPPGSGVEGYILTDQVRAIDWRDRHAKVAGRASEELVQSILTMVRSFLA